jgi:hypothetical protein
MHTPPELDARQLHIWMQSIHDAVSFALPHGDCGLEFSWEICGWDLDPGLGFDLSFTATCLDPRADRTLLTGSQVLENLRDSDVRATNERLRPFGLVITRSTVEEVERDHGACLRVKLDIAPLPLDKSAHIGSLTPNLGATPRNQHIPAMEPSAITPFVGLRGVPEDHFHLSDGAKLRVYYLDVYFPKRFAESRTHLSTLRIGELKNGHSDAVRHFSDMLIPRLAKKQPIPTIVAIPGHKPGAAAPNSGLRQIIDRIDGAVDLSDCLMRTVEVPKSAGAAPGMRLDAKAHIETMDVRNPALLAGKHVILMDDVITKGETMRAARYLLVKHTKPASLTCLSLTRTRFGAAATGESATFTENEIPF